MTHEGIMLSDRGNVQLVHPEDNDAWLECILGWRNEKVTHLVLEPNEKLCHIIEEDREGIQSWIGDKLASLFGNVPVPAWEI